MMNNNNIGKGKNTLYFAHTREEKKSIHTTFSAAVAAVARINTIHQVNDKSNCCRRRRRRRYFC